MALLDPYELPPLDNWEAFQAWLARQGAQPEAARIPLAPLAPPTVAPELNPSLVPAVVASPPTEEETNKVLQEIQERTERELVSGELPPLDHAAVQRAVPEEVDPWARGELLPLAVRKQATPSLPETLLEVTRSIASTVNPLAKLIPPSKNVAFPAKPGFYKKAEEIVEGKAPLRQVDPFTGQVEVSEEAISAGSGLANLALTGGLAGTGVKATLRRPELTKWVEENPRASFVEEPIKLIPEEGVLGSTGVLQKRSVTTRGGFYHTKVREEFALGKEKVNVTYSVAKGRAGGAEADIDFSVLAPHEKTPSFVMAKPVAAKATTPAQGRDTLFTVASSVEKFIDQTKPERVTFVAADDRLVSTYDAFARSLARKYDGVVVESPLEGGMATIEFPKNRGNQFDPGTLRSGLPDFAAIMGGTYIAAGTAPYIIRGAINAAKRTWPKLAIRTGTILDPSETLGPRVLMNFDRPKDLMKTITSSPVSGMLSLIKGLGYNKKALFDAFESNTLASEGQKIANAVDSGSLVSIAGDYKVPDGLSAARVTNAVRSLPQDKQIAASQYVHYHDMLRRMRASGSNRVSGMSLRDIQTNIRAIEASFPEAKKFLEMHNKVMQENLRFVGDGAEAILTPKQVAAMQKGTYALHEFEPVDPNLPLSKRISERAHAYGGNEDIAPSLLDKKIGLTNAPRVDAFEMLNRATEIMLRSKIANSRRIKLIQAMISTGKDAVVQVGRNQKEYKALISNHPKWKDRITMVREGGIPKYYISSKFIKDMLHLDPHIAKHFWLYATSRAFQFGTTGYGKPGFALTQLYREAILGPLSTPKGYRGVGIPGVPFSALPQAALSVMEQAGRRWQKSFADELYRSLDSGSGGVLRQVFDDKTLRAWADGLADSYSKSLYNLYAQRGGPGISMASSPIAAAQKGIWQEITRNSQMPGYVRQAAHIYMNLFDAMQNSTRYAFWKANYKKGKKAGKVTSEFLDDINIQSRHLTGELMISGRTYKGKGQLIESDYPKKATNAAIPAYARSLDALRESTVWVNAFIKGQERIARAYWENPFKFTTYMYTGVFLPMTFAYMWAAAKGDEYLDYLENGRSEYEKGASIYLPPLEEGAKPEDGWAIPIPPEIAPLVYMYWNVLSSSFGKEFGDAFGNVPSTQDQAKSILKNWFGLVTPPVISATSAAFGVKVPGSIPSFGEEPYKIKEDPYSWFDPNIENYLKAAFGNATDAFIKPMNTLLTEGDAMGAWKEFWYQQKQQFPTVKKQQLHGFTELSEAYWDRLDKLNKLEDIYEAHISREGKITKEQQGDVIGYGPEFNLIPETRVKLTKKGVPYKRGTKEVVPGQDPRTLLQDLPVELLGRPEILPPTNPEYIAFAKEVHDHFNARGSGAYGNLVSRLSNATKQIQSLKRENSGTLKDVKARVASMPDDEPLKAELQQIDWSKRDSLREAINVMEKERRRVYKTMNYYVREVEEKLGTKLDTLDPYAPPSPLHLGIGAP